MLYSQRYHALNYSRKASKAEVAHLFSRPTAHQVVEVAMTKVDQDARVDQDGDVRVVFLGVRCVVAEVWVAVLLVVSHIEFVLDEVVLLL